MSHHGRAVTAAVLMTLALTLGPAPADADPAASHIPSTASASTRHRWTPSTHWAVPLVFAGHDHYSEPQHVFDGPFRRFTAQVGASSVFRMRSFHWHGWRSHRAVGRGRVAFCNYQGCEALHRARLVLYRKRPTSCGDGGGVDFYSYRRYRLVNFWHGTHSYRSARPYC